MMNEGLKLIFFISCSLCYTFSSPIQNDPCFHITCPQGEICMRSIDAISYNCIKEDQYLKRDEYNNMGDLELALKPRDSVTNYPVNYFEKYMTFNPCLSSPCAPRQICRNLGKNEYICQSEIHAFADINDARSMLREQSKLNVWENLQEAFHHHKAYRKIKPLKAVTQKLKDEDYEVISPETIHHEIGDICKTSKSGTKLINPLRINQYIICLDDTFIIRNCHRGSVFNTFTEKCENTRDIPTKHLEISNPCLNNSTFVQENKFQYRCDCPPGFTGKNCEKVDICEPSFCGMNGVCLSIGYEQEVSHMCWCNNGVEIGLDCESSDTLESNPCLDMNTEIELHALKLNPTVYVECGEENKPVLHSCQHPLVFSEKIQECDWETDE